MSGISFIGSYSGIDTSTIEQLMAAERIPLNSLNSKKTNITEQQDAWKDINTRLNSLSSKLRTLQNTSTFTSMKSSSSNQDIFTVSSSSSAVAGRYEIKVGQLATGTRITGGKIDQVYSEGSFNALNTEGSFAIENENGKSARIDIVETDTLRDVVDKINAKTKDTGINATIINERLVLTDEKTGERGITLGEVKDSEENPLNSEVVLERLGLSMGKFDGDYTDDSLDPNKRITVNSGQNALLKINDIEVTSESNTVSDKVLGLTINLNKAHDGMLDSEGNFVGSAYDIITVSNDTEKLTQALEEFVDQYNSTMGFIEEKMSPGTITAGTTVGRGVLAGDSSLKSLHDSLRRMVTDTISNEGTDIRDISALGVTTVDRYGQLTFDPSKLLKTFSEDPQGVTNFFNYKPEGQDETIGFVSRLNERIDSYISTSDGLIKSKNDSFARTLKDINDRIERFEERMVKREEYYIKTFTALDVAMMEAESQMSWLVSQIDGLNAQMGANR